MIFDEMIFDEMIFDEMIFDEMIFDEMIFDEVSNPQRQHQHEQHIKTFQLTEKSFLTTMTKHISKHFFQVSRKKNVFLKKFHPAFINLSNWPRKCFLMKECVHFRLSLFQESLTFWEKRRKKKKRQKQKQKNSFKYFYSFHCFVAAKPQTLTTTVITKLNNSNIIKNQQYYFC